MEPSFANAYGLTETHGVATLNGGKDLLDKKTSVGRPMPLLDMKLVDEEGKEVAEGALGELLIRGPLVTPGYWNRPDATAEAVQDGWLHTGDLAYRDSDGFLFVVDRAKDMIIRGGENVYCVEIENCLADHPEIDEAAIVGLPDPEFGERVKAIVRRVPGSSLGEDAVRRQVAGHLASFKVPEVIEFIDMSRHLNPSGAVIGITSHPDSGLRDRADIVLDMGVIEEPCPLGLTPSASIAAMSAIADALTLTLMERKGVTREQYGIRHHGGYLGRKARTDNM